ncbi:MAG: selenoprotein B glycine/betaine/sarcosine/D-proline reductase [Gemmatimonadota bacterium]|nr:selenoprotein B glycine/betaine/sarcosine/D-proline reductase [Gemmatimonadota bacterium]MDE3173802.1 selenoprotein B glycine/betaine/sarcosine/D-proline reductase [Gemmatimonadota bacterium]
MADFSDLPLAMRLPLAVYPWRRVDPVPWVPGSKPLTHARVALITSAALYRPGIDAPFEEVRGGDSSMRWLPDDVVPHTLAVGHPSHAFDRTPVDRDRNIAFPLDRLHEMVAQCVVGSAASRHVSFNGSMTAPGRFLRHTAPGIAAGLIQDRVDTAILVPI